MRNKKIFNKTNIYLSGILFAYLIAMGLLFLSKPVHAATSEDGVWSYTENSDGTVDLTKYNGTDETVTVPAEIDGYSVKELSFTFQGNTTVKSVTISEGIISLNSTFYSCSNMENVILPESLKKIYSNSFYLCTSLKELKLGENIDYINYDFFDSINLETFIVDEDNPTYYSDGVLLFDKEKTKVIAAPIHDLKKYLIPNTVKKIDSYGLANTELGSDTLPDSIESIGYNGLYGAGPEDASLVLPTSLKSIGNYAFGVSKFKSIKFGVNVEEIGLELFQGCHQYLKEIIIDEDNPNLYSDGIAIYSKDKSVLYTTLKSGIDSYTISDGVKTIKNYAFYNNDLKNIVIPDGVETIGDYAFASMNNLTSISLPDSVTSIDKNALYYCSNLTDVKLSKNITEIPYQFMEHCSSVESIEIPYGVTTIDDYAFDNCTSLTDVIIPYGVTTIGRYAFDNCTSLADITLPNTLTSIRAYTFCYCTKLKTVTIPESVTGISVYAFTGCSDSLVFNVKEGSYADSYAQSKGFTCNYITEKECEHTWSDGEVTTEPTTSSTGIMTYTCIKCGETKTEDIPMLEEEEDTSNFTFSLLSDGTYQVDSYTGNASSVVIPQTYNGNNVTAIGPEAFYNNDNIKVIKISNNIKTIDSSAFYGCNNLEAINVDSNNLYFISIAGVLYNEDITALYTCPPKAVGINYEIPYGVMTIKGCAFRNCSSLQTVTIPNTVYDIEYRAFENCQALETVRVPKQVTTIGSYVFDGCEELTLEVYEGSMAESYAYNNDIPHIYVNEYTYGNYKYEINGDNTIVITGYTGYENEVVIPETIYGTKVTEIGDRVFADNNYVNRITVGENISSIGNEAFADCDNLQTVVFRGDNVSFGDFVFDGSDNVEVIANRESDAWEYASDSGVYPHECTHDWGEGVVTTPASVTSEGERTYTCSICGATKTETIPKPTCSHVWDNGVVTTPATTTSEGVKTYTCNICGATKTEVIPILTHSHEWDNGVVTTAATTTSEGVKTYTCQICGETRTETIAKLAAHTVHTWNSGVVTKPATVKATGIKTYTCTVCGTTKTETIPKLTCSHTWNGGEVTIEATVLNEGTIVYTCTRCGEKKTETIPKQDIKIGSQAKVDGMVCIITSTDKRTVKCTGIYNNNMTEVNLGTTQIRINNDVYVIDSIGDYAFSGCSAGVKINLSNNKKLKSVGKGAFGSLSAQNIIYPSSAKLKTQYQKLVSGSKKSHTEISGKGIYRVLDENKKTAMFVSGTDSSAKTISIPATVTLSGNKYKVISVGPKALYNYKKVNKIVFGSNIEIVYKDAISGCERLDDLKISSKKLKTFKKSIINKVNSKKLNVDPPAGKENKYKKMLKAALKIRRKKK